MDNPIVMENITFLCTTLFTLSIVLSLMAMIIVESCARVTIGHCFISIGLDTNIVYSQ